jgi:hypothetical protein
MMEEVGNERDVVQSTATISAFGFLCAIVMPNAPCPAAMSRTVTGVVPPPTRSAMACAFGIIIGIIARANSTQIGLSSATELWPVSLTPQGSGLQVNIGFRNHRFLPSATYNSAFRASQA